MATILWSLGGFPNELPAPPDMDFLAAVCAREGFGPPDGLPVAAPGTVNLLTENKHGHLFQMLSSS